MSKRSNKAIKAAIDNFEIAKARQLLREAIKDADAETYYLASQVVTDDAQKRKFLEKAVLEDESHKNARKALNDIKKSSNGRSSTITKTSAPPKRERQANLSNHPDLQGQLSFLTSENYASSPDTTYYQKRRSSYELAGIGSRFVANIIDGIALMILVSVVSFIYGLTVPKGVYLRGDMSQYETTANLLGFGVTIVYYLYFLTMQDGQTPGKSAMKIQIIKTNGKSLNLADAFIRNVIGYAVSSVFLLLGYIWALFDGERQTWHDKIAGTVVVKA